MTRIVPQFATAAAPASSSSGSSPDRASSIRKVVSTHRPDLEPFEHTYRYIHSHPCLGFVEYDTAALVVNHISRLEPKFDIKTRIGHTGVAAVFRNGPGPTVLLRADMDGLPVEEQTGLPYASKKRMRDIDGVEQPVMHACGHDMHVTSLLAATDLLHAARESWSGTLICLFQQAEEKSGGAEEMVNDGLYTKHGVPIPDVCLGGHVLPFKTGRVTLKQGAAMAASDSMEITLFGKGGHASMPSHTIDPVLMAAATVMRLQGVVSREVDPLDSAVVTVGSIHAGMAENIIVDQAKIKVNIRTYDTAVRDRVLAAVKRIVRAEAQASGAPKEPEFHGLGSFPVTNNDEKTTAKVQGAFGEYFGEGYQDAPLPMQGSEDFSILGHSVGAPCCFWLYGGHDAKDWEEREKAGTTGDIPINHSPYFAPVIRPTLDTAVDALSVAALSWLLK